MEKVSQVRSDSESISRAGATDLARLRALLLGKDYQRLLLLQKDFERLLALRERYERLLSLEPELTDRDKYAGRVADVLSEAMLLREQADQGVSRTLSPSIAESIKASVRKDPQALVDAIFPVMGPAIRKAVSEAIDGMLQTFNQLLEHSFSPRSLKWRFEAWRTGKTYAEIVLLRTLLYRVQQVFLLHRETGLLLHHVVTRESTVRDPNLVGGMLTAIRDFMSDSFALAEGADLESIQVGEYTVLLEEGPRAVLALVVSGNPPAELQQTMRRTIETVHLLHRAELEAFNGDATPFEATRGYLEDCLQSRPRPEIRRRPWKAALLLMILTLGPLAYWGYETYRRHRLWTEVLAKVRSEPGIVVVSAKKTGEGYRVQGLKDPLAHDPGFLIAPEIQAELTVDWRWRPYLSIEPPLLMARARQVLRPPDTVTLALDGDLLVLAGEAPQDWIDELARRVTGIPGITGYRDAELIPAGYWRRELTRHRQAIESTELYFGPNQVMPDEAQTQRLDTLIQSIGGLQAAAARLDVAFRIRITGHADASGSEKTNLELSRQRAEAVLQELVNAGLDRDLFQAVGAGARAAASDNESATDRRVTFGVAVEDRKPQNGLVKEPPMKQSGRNP